MVNMIYHRLQRCPDLESQIVNLLSAISWNQS